MSINVEKAKIFEEVLTTNKGIPKKWIWVCLRYIYFYLGNHKDSLELAKDIIMEIVEKTITEQIKWDMDKETLDTHMYNTIWNKVSHMAEKQRRFVENERYDEKSGIHYSITEEFSDKTKEEIDTIIDNNDLIKKCYEEINDDTEMGILFLLLLEGKTPKEIEKDYGIPTEKQDAIKKRIKRVLTKHFGKEY